jgi:hypothetical protein
MMMSNSIRVIFPYRSNRVWMFDDDAMGLYREPFVCGIPEMLSVLVGDIQEPYIGFALYFSDQQFPGFQIKMDLLGPEDGGNWYKLTVGETEMKGWLCPALFKYFDAAPASIYAKAEAIDHGPTSTAHGSFWQRLWRKF